MLVEKLSRNKARWTKWRRRFKQDKKELNGVFKELGKSLFHEEEDEQYTHTYISGHKWSATYGIIDMQSWKTMFPPGYQHNSFVATHAIGHMIC